MLLCAGCFLQRGLAPPRVQAYVDELSRDLQAELGAHGVTVENQAPFYVATKMSKIRKPRLDAPSPATWAAAGLKQARYHR